jgi:hypothetical protein
MATIRPATERDLDAVAGYLAGALKGGPPARYRSFLDYAWLPDKPDLGMLIEDGARIGGFIGAIYSDRRYNGELRRFCNLTSIAVDEPYRSLTLQLFSALFKRRELTFTCLSASQQVEKILRFFKFEHRASDRVLVAPISGLAGLRHRLSAPRARVITRSELLAELDPDQQVIARDHAAYRCGLLLIVRGARRCFTVTVRRGRGWRAFADVLYASDPDLLLESLPWVHGPLLRAHGTVLTGIDRRWVRHAPTLSVTYTRLRPTYARSTTVRFDQIDGLYSELVPMHSWRQA